MTKVTVIHCKFSRAGVPGITGGCVAFWEEIIFRDLHADISHKSCLTCVKGNRLSAEAGRRSGRGWGSWPGPGPAPGPCPAS